MRLIDLEIAGFGKLVNRKISFDENLTVIYGLNEAGKSTVHACIRAMLFGMPRARGAAAEYDDYSRFRPWKSQSYGAVLRFEDAGHIYKLTRNFAEDPLGCTMFNETDGCETENPGRILERALSGMTMKTFENTVSIGQLKTSTDPSMAAELNEYLVNLNTAGDRTLSTGKAGEYLNRQKDALRRELSPDAARLYAANTAEIKKLEGDLAAMPVIDREKLSGELKDTIDRIEHNSERRNVLASETAENDRLRERVRRLKTAARVILILMLVFLVIAAAAWLMGAGNASAYGITYLMIFIPAGVLTLICLILEIIFRIIIANKKRNIRKEKEEELTVLDSETEQLNLRNQQISKAMLEGDSTQVRITDMISRLNELRDRNDRLTEIMAENDRINSDIEAIDIALSAMDELSDHMSRSFGHHLNQEASRHIRELTGGAYDALSVDEDFHVLINSGEKMVPLNRLSAGTKEQVYLAVRLAVAKLMQGDAGEPDPLPVIFDDSFVNYDDDRIVSAIRWIASAYEGQILFFSCQFREMDILDTLGVPHVNIRL